SCEALDGPYALDGRRAVRGIPLPVQNPLKAATMPQTIAQVGSVRRVRGRPRALVVELQIAPGVPGAVHHRRRHGRSAPDPPFPPARGPLPPGVADDAAIPSATAAGRVL